LLNDPASTIDVQTLLDSEINGSVPLFVSPDALARVLNSTASARLLLLRGSGPPTQEPVRPDVSSGIQHEDESGGVGLFHVRPPVYAASTGPKIGKDDARRLSTPRTHPRLSEREVQILNGLMKGHTNKVIARTCDITKSTVSCISSRSCGRSRQGIGPMRANWALEHGYVTDDAGAHQ
jgi:two-component system nitrate/nitrite response regulator NarL